MSDIIHRLGLGPGKVFVDLGSGVGNCVLQAALQYVLVSLLPPILPGGALFNAARFFVLSTQSRL